MKVHKSVGEKSRLSFSAALQANIHTLKALLIRDIMIRYKREGLGFAWLILEPMILTIMVMLLWSILYGSLKHGVSVLGLVLTGYSFLTLWRHIVGRSIFVLRLGFDLKYHRAIHYGDIVLSRYFQEFLAVQLAFWIVYVLLFLIGLLPEIYDLHLVVLSWILFGFLSVGIGMIIVSITEISESAERFIQPLMYVTIPLTGAFYMVAWLPYQAQDAVIWSPMVHAVEMLRAGVFGPKISTIYDGFYLFLCGLISNGIGWGLFNIAKNRVESLN